MFERYFEKKYKVKFDPIYFFFIFKTKNGIQNEKNNCQNNEKNSWHIWPLFLFFPYFGSENGKKKQKEH